MTYVHDVQKAIYLVLGLLVIVVVFVILKKKFHSKMNQVASDTDDKDNKI